MDFAIDHSLVCEHLQWLSHYSPPHGKKWQDMLANQPEAAMCEAAVRQLLESHGASVEPNEGLRKAKKAPDFRCTKNGQNFYVEVTCIEIDTATKATKLDPSLLDSPDAQRIRWLSRPIFNDCVKKASQCGNLEFPALVAIGTFHGPVSAFCTQDRQSELLLTGETSIAARIDPMTGDTVSDIYQSTELRSAAFLGPAKATRWENKRNSISALLICGFGCLPPLVKGVLHPSPVRPFDRTLLCDIPFCRVRPDCKPGVLDTEWI